jgi:ABC-type oligopeptide transport system ATPase subunit
MVLLSGAGKTTPGMGLIVIMKPMGARVLVEFCLTGAALAKTTRSKVARVEAARAKAAKIERMTMV